MYNVYIYINNTSLFTFHLYLYISIFWLEDGSKSSFGRRTIPERWAPVLGLGGEATIALLLLCSPRLGVPGFNGGNHWFMMVNKMVD